MSSFALRLCALALALNLRGEACAQETRTAFEFSRPLDTCAEEGDRTITGTSRIIYSWNDEDPGAEADSAPMYHGPSQRGTESVNVNAPQPNFPIVEEDIITIQLNNSLHTIQAGVGTSYYCKIFELPSDQTYHIVSFDMVINQTNFANVHHALLFECPAAAGTIEGDGLTDGEQTWCGGFGDDLPEGVTAHPYNGCQSLGVVWAWAIGGSANILPPHVGYPIGAGETSTFLLQMHYDMPDLEGVTDDSGMELKLTPTLRETEAGIMQVGVASTPQALVIPPGEADFMVEGYCPNEGLGPAINATEAQSVTLFSVFLHAHLAGRHITLRHSREGTELPIIADDPSYDFNYQEYLWFDEPVTMRPEDDFTVQCYYDTTNRTEVTVGGEATMDEMCLAFIMFYPRLPTGGNCVTIPTNDTHVLLLASSPNSRTNVPRPEIVTPYVEESSCTGNEAHPRYGSSAPLPLDVESMSAWRASFENSRVLGGGAGGNVDQYTMYWTTHNDNETVRFGIDVATSGWVGFGFSPNGGMVDADVVMAWVDDESQELFFSDRFAAAQDVPQIDTAQDYFGVRGIQYTVGTPCASHDDCLEDAICDSDRLCRFCLGGECPGGADSESNPDAVDASTSSASGVTAGTKVWAVAVACVGALLRAF